MSWWRGRRHSIKFCAGLHTEDIIHMERLKRKYVYPEDGHVSQLLRLLQDIAADDAERRGGGMDVLAAKNCAWVIVKVRADIARMPRAGEEIELCTWPQKSRLAIYPRAYEVRGEDGELILNGLGTWVIMDVDSRSLVSGQSRGVSIAGEEESAKFHPQARIIVPDGGREYELVPAESQIDRNGHMNNAAYLDAVEPMLPEAYRGRELCALAVDYEHEILPERRATVRAVAEGDNCFFEGWMDDKSCFRIRETFASEN